tara:strand:+ start:40 stop:627 length:588 start_codon:yes stop_codon:yes gene_type:complete
MIYTQHQDRQIALSYPVKKERTVTIDDMSFSVVFTSYIESLLTDFNTMLELKIDESIKKKVRQVRNKHDSSSFNWLSDPKCLEISNNLTKQIDIQRNKNKVKFFGKKIDELHYLNYITYELRILLQRFSQLDYQETSPYYNSLKGLINACDNSLVKKGFLDKMETHTKKDQIQSVLLGFEREFKPLFKEGIYGIK